MTVAVKLLARQRRQNIEMTAATQANGAVELQSSTGLPRFYQPFTTRTPFLLTVLVAVFVCIGSLEYLFDTGFKPSDEASPKRLLKRQGASTNAASAPLTTTSSADPAEVSTLYPSSTNAGAFVTIDTPTTTTTTPTTVDSPTTTSTTTTSPSTTSSPTTKTTSSSIYFSTDEGAHITIETESADSGDFITIDTKGAGTTTTGRVTVASANPESFLTVDTITTGTISTTSEDTGFTTTPQTSILPPTPLQTSILPLTQVTVTQQSIVSATVVSGTFRPASTQDVTSIATVAISETTITTINEQGQTTLIATSTTVAPPLQTQGSISKVTAAQLQIGTKYTEQTYFVSNYLGVLIAVCLKLTWGLVFSGLKLMEPFYQLSRPEGASAKESLLADYLSPGLSLQHFRHILTGHWVMLFGSVAYVAMAVLSPVVSEAMTTIATSYCPNTFGKLSPCQPVWVVNLSVARGLEAVLCIVAALIIIVIVLNWRRKSGIFNNPSSAASMAALLSHEDMLTQLRQLDQRAPNDSIVAALSGTKYTMMSYELSPGSGIWRYGITKTTSGANSPYALANTHNFDYESRNKYQALTNPSNMYLQDDGIVQEQQHPTTSRRFYRDMIFFCALLGLFGVVLAYYLEGGHTPFNDFFNSGRFGPKFTLTAIAALIDFHWKTLEREVRIYAPYRRLHHRNADAQHSVLVDVGGVPIFTIWGALARGEIFHSIVAFTAILSDVLIIAISGVPFSTASIWKAFLASTYLSLAILAIMLLVMLGIFWWQAQIKKLRLPREPDSILAVWLMMCEEQNELRKEFNGWEGTTGGHRDRAARGRGGRYCGGWAKSLDGVERWSIGVEGNAGGGGGMIPGYT